MRAQEFIQENKESFNWEIMQPGFEFEQEINGVTYKVTNAEGQLTVMAYDQRGNVIGHAVFWKHQTRYGLESLSTEVNDKWQGKGIAANMYALVRMLGANINPSLFQTKQGKHMWKKWQQQGDARHLKHMNAKIKENIKVDPVTPPLRTQPAQVQPKQNVYVAPDKKKTPAAVIHINKKVNEAFDQPYPLSWEKSEYGDVDALARLPDGSPLSIMFNQQQGEEGEEVVQIEFYRNNDQEVTGEGDAQRVFATVLTAIQQYITEYKPLKLTFSASKLLDPTIYYEPDEPQPNPASRAKLYDRMIQRYARAWGYRALRADTGSLVIYELSRINPVSENFADGKVKGKSRPGRVKRAGASCDGSVTDLRQRAKNASGEKAKMYHWCANMKSGRKK